MTDRHENLLEGTEVHYTGDAANLPGWGRIVAVRPPDRWVPTASYDILLEAEEGEDPRLFRGVRPASFEGIGRRFVTRTEYEEERRLKVEAFLASRNNQ